MRARCANSIGKKTSSLRVGSDEAWNAITFFGPYYCFVSVNDPPPPAASLNVPERVVPEMVPVMLPPDCWLVGSVTVRLNEPLASTEPFTFAVSDWVLPLEVVVRVPLKVPPVS